MHLLRSPSRQMGYPIQRLFPGLGFLPRHHPLCQASAGLIFQTRHKHTKSLPYRPTPPQPSQPPKTHHTPQPSSASEFAKTARPHTVGRLINAIVEAGPGVSVVLAKDARYIRTGIFALVFSAGVFAWATYHQARKELTPEPAPVPTSYRDQRRDAIPVHEIPQIYWSSLDPISKLSIGLIGVNGASHLYRMLLPSYANRMQHVPSTGSYRTLVTSMFVHFGFMHLGVNMWACYNFLPIVGYSNLFEGNPNHTLAFFLASGVLSSWVQHLWSGLENPYKAALAGRIPRIYHPSGGASGALYAVFGAFCMQYPNAGVGIIFLPFSVAASTFLPFVMAFDAYGLLFGFKRFHLGHAAHLSGALLGIGYSYFDGKNNLWKPLVHFWKHGISEKST